MNSSAEGCLKKVQRGLGVVETFTEGTFCMLEGAKNVSSFFKNKGGVGFREFFNETNLIFYCHRDAGEGYDLRRWSKKL